MISQLISCCGGGHIESVDADGRVRCNGAHLGIFGQSAGTKIFVLLFLPEPEQTSEKVCERLTQRKFECMLVFGMNPHGVKKTLLSKILRCEMLQVVRTDPMEK